MHAFSVAFVPRSVVSRNRTVACRFTWRRKRRGQLVSERKLMGRQRHTIIFVTHAAHIAAHAQRIIRVCDGKVEKDESTK